MKFQIVILWTAAFLITLLAMFLGAVTGPDFPLTGTIGLGGKQLTYRFEKQAAVKDTFSVMLRNDADSVYAYMDVLSMDTTRIAFVPENNGKTLRASLRVRKIPATIAYKVNVIAHSEIHALPEDGRIINTRCVGKVPPQISQVYFLTLFLGLLLGLRAALEFFTDGKKIKKLALFATISFNMFGFFVYPVKQAFALNVIDRAIVQPGALFSLQAFAPGLFWIVVTLALFIFKKEKPTALAAGLLTILLIIFLHF